MITRRVRVGDQRRDDEERFRAAARRLLPDSGGMTVDDIVERLRDGAARRERTRWAALCRDAADEIEGLRVDVDGLNAEISAMKVVLIEVGCLECGAETVMRGAFPSIQEAVDSVEDEWRWGAKNEPVAWCGPAVMLVFELATSELLAWARFEVLRDGS